SVRGTTGPPAPSPPRSRPKIITKTALYIHLASAKQETGRRRHDDYTPARNRTPNRTRLPKELRMAALSFDVAGIGNAIVDVLAQADEAFLQREALAKGSMTLIDEARAEALYAAMGPAREVSGGSAANTLAGLASLGASAAFIG